MKINKTANNVCFRDISKKNVIDQQCAYNMPSIIFTHPSFGNIKITFGYDFIIFGVKKNKLVKDLPFFKEATQVNESKTFWLSLEHTSYIFSGHPAIFSALNLAEKTGLLADEYNFTAELLRLIEYYKTVLRIENNLYHPSFIEEIENVLKLKPSQTLSPILDFGVAYLRLAQAYTRQFQSETRIQQKLTLRKQAYTAYQQASTSHANPLEIATGFCELLALKTNTHDELIKTAINYFVSSSEKKTSDQAFRDLDWLFQWVNTQKSAETLEPLVAIFNNGQEKEMIKASFGEELGSAFKAELTRLKACIAKQVGDEKAAYDTYCEIESKYRSDEDWLNLGNLFISLGNPTPRIALLSETEIESAIQKLANQFPFFIRAYLQGRENIQDDALRILKRLAGDYYDFTKQKSDDIKLAISALFEKSDQTIVNKKCLNPFLLRIESNADKTKRESILNLMKDVQEIVDYEKKRTLFHRDLNSKELAYLPELIDQIENCGTKKIDEILTQAVAKIPSIIATYPRIQEFFESNHLLTLNNNNNNNNNSSLFPPSKKQKVA